MPKRGTLVSVEWSQPRNGVRRTIYRHLRSLIARGHVSAGSRLPSTRTLAADLRVSRNSVCAAFELLLDEGLIESRRGSGCYVAARQIQPVQLHAASPDPALKVSSHRAMPRRTAPRFAVPASEFPLGAWKAAQKHALESGSLCDVLGNGFAADLRQAIAEHFAVSRGILCSRDDIFFFRNEAEALRSLLEATTNRGDAVAALNGTEDVVSPHASALGLELADDVPRVIVCAPNHDEPFGRTMNGDDRARVVATAEKNHSWIVELDRFGDLWYADPPRTLKRADGSGRVIFIQSLGDVLPPLEMTIAAVPRALALHLASSMQPTVSTLALKTVARLFETGLIPSRVRRLRAVYAHRRRRLLATLESLPDRRTVFAPAFGLHVMCSLDDACDDVRLASLIAETGVAAVAMSTLAGAPSPRGLLISFASDISRLLDRLQKGRL